MFSLIVVLASAQDRRFFTGGVMPVMPQQALAPGSVPVPLGYEVPMATSSTSSSAGFSWMAGAAVMTAGAAVALRAKVSLRAGAAAMSATADGFVPDMQRRTIMNLVLLGGAAVPVGWMGGGFVYFFVPPAGKGGGGGVAALDAKGDAVKSKAWAANVPYPARSLVQGLRGDAHYLIVKQDGSLEDYAINAVCTHLGCVVPWNRAANKYMCPCHGSQYDPTGKVIRGPAPLSLALAHLAVDESDTVQLTSWTETDFRTNTPPWWKA
jgi:cytochrome b6-f complex iron-sulfur subunit